VGCLSLAESESCVDVCGWLMQGASESDQGKSSSGEES